MTIDLHLIDSAIRQAELEMEEVIVESQAKVVILVDQALVLATPVDTGRARANWTPTIGTPSTEYKKGSYDKSGSNAISEATNLTKSLKPGDDFYISNNAPYIGALNDGHSKQAPAGFVEKAVQVARSSLE